MKASFMIANENIPEELKVTGLTGDFSKTFKDLVLNGYDRYELMIDDPEKVDQKKIKYYNKTFNVKMIFLCSGEMAGIAGLSLNDIDDDRRNKAVRKLMLAIDLAANFGVNINIGRLRGTIYNDGKLKSLERLAKSLKEIDDYILKESKDTLVLIEPLREDICPILNSCEETKSFIEKSNLKNFKILLDSDHMNIESDPHFIKKNIDWIKHVHLADTKHEPIGKGKINFNNFIKLLTDSGYEGEYSVEVFCEKDQNKTLKESYEFLKDLSFLKGDFYE